MYYSIPPPGMVPINRPPRPVLITLLGGGLIGVSLLLIMAFLLLFPVSFIGVYFFFEIFIGHVTAENSGFVFLGCTSALFGVCLFGILAGWGLLGLKPWSRILTTVLMLVVVFGSLIFMVLSMQPGLLVGTFVGGLVFAWYLNLPTTKEVFEPRAVGGMDENDEEDARMQFFEPRPPQPPPDQPK